MFASGFVFKHYSIRTEDSYVQWTRRFTLFHGKGHPSEMGAVEVEAFLTHLATVRLLHEKDLAEDFGEVHLPYALDRKYPNAGKR